MKIIDIAEPNRINRKPDQTITLIHDGTSIQDGFQIKTVEMRSYIQNTNEKLGHYTIISELRFCMMMVTEANLH